MGKRTEFLYLSEPDCIAAGVLDAKKCVDNAEEVFRLLAKGDYLMGGAGRNSHGPVSYTHLDVYKRQPSKQPSASVTIPEALDPV